jgi:heme oxygenase (biliverdin-IX-beta and delta-forming)
VTMTTERPEQAERAQRLRAETHALHEQLDSGIVQQRPFESVQRYAAFLRGQLAFQQEIEPIYQDARLNALFPGLASRSRLALTATDLDDLGESVTQAARAENTRGLGESLGWLYVSEGSTLGAAFLLKEVQKLGLSEDNGARHLAAHPEGRGLHWRRFVEGLNAADLGAADEAGVVEGARSAFAHASASFADEFARLGA